MLWDFKPQDYTDFHVINDSMVSYHISFSFPSTLFFSPFSEAFLIKLFLKESLIKRTLFFRKRFF